MEEVHLAAPTDTPGDRSPAPAADEVVVKSEPIDFEPGVPISGSVTGTEEDEPYDYQFDQETEAGPSGTSGEEPVTATAEGGPIVITIGENISEEARKRKLALENRK